MPQHNDRLGHLTPALVRHADHGHVSQRGVLGQHTLNLGGIDVLSTANDHVLDAVGHVYVAVAVDVAAIARAVPAVGRDRSGGGVGLAPVAPHHLLAAYPDLTGLAGRHGLAGSGVADLDFHAVDGLAGRNQPVRDCGVLVVLRAQNGDHATLLGHAVHLLHGTTREKF